VPVILAGSMRTEDIIRQQYIVFLFAIPLTAFIFIVSSMAELGRAPFDLLEAESEIVAGFHTEYSGMKFGMFYVGEFLHTFTVAVLAAMFFLGGWRGPFADDTGFLPRLLGLVYLSIKSQIAYLALMWVRMTVPRVRIDQMLGFNWKFLVPLSLVNLLVVAFVWKLIPDTDQINSFREALLPSLVLLIANLAMIAGVAMILRAQGRRERARLQVYYAGAAAGETAAD
ncbi:MAG: NADH-quinone oxidoreductase subunit H, partial [Chloroflexi bacterium]